jgi:hypothetical protein
MLKLWTDRGTSLVEALVAASLLITLLGGVAYLLLQSHRSAVLAEHTTMATVAASAKLEQLRAVPWEFGWSGANPDVPALALSPAGALERDLEGFYDRLDESGQPVVAFSASQHSFVRRWAIMPAASGADVTRAIEVCVLPAPAQDGAHPAVCLASARTRQP